MEQVCIYGAGIQGQIFYDVLTRLGQSIECFLDDYSELETYNDRPVFRQQHIQDKNIPVYISVGMISKKVAIKLKNLGFTNVYDYTETLQKFPELIPALMIHSLWYSENPAEMVNRDKISQFRELLSDEKSRKTLDQISDFRSNPTTETYVIPQDETQYFPSDIDTLSGIDELRFVDAGAYTGDTLSSLCAVSKKQGVEIDYVACFEPDVKNISKLKNTAVQVMKETPRTHIFVYSSGVWSRSEILTFSASGTASSHVSSNAHALDTQNISIPGTSIDDTLFCASPNFIKMDIEGAEREALLGCQNTIEAYTPTLAICLYHKPRDLWELPLLIHSFKQDYKMYIRVYGDMLLETVLYCIPSNSCSEVKP